MLSTTTDDNSLPSSPGVKVLLPNKLAAVGVWVLERVTETSTRRCSGICIAPGDAEVTAEMLDAPTESGLLSGFGVSIVLFFYCIVLMLYSDQH